MTRAWALALLLLVSSVRADDTDARYQHLIGELRCLVCQNQTIAESNAPLAADLREQVRQQMDAGRSDEEIVEYLTARYGDFVRYRPAFKPQTWLLWLGPFAVLLGAIIAAALIVRRSRPPATAAADASALQRLLDETDKKP